MPDPIKLYLDEDTISQALINALLARNIDVITTREADLISASDEDQLAYAVSVGRSIFTFNRRDFIRLHTEYVSSGRHHSGIIVSNQVQVGLLIHRMLKLLNARSAEDLQDMVEFLGNWR